MRRPSQAASARASAWVHRLRNGGVLALTAAEDHVVLEDHVAVQLAGVDAERKSRPLDETPVRQSTPLGAMASMASKTSWPLRPCTRARCRVEHSRWKRCRHGGKRRPGRLRGQGLQPGRDLCEDVDIEAALHPEEGSQQADPAPPR